MTKNEIKYAVGFSYGERKLILQLSEQKVCIRR